MKRIIKTSKPNRPTTGVRRLRPTARPPAPSVLQRLSQADREQLERLLSEPQECVYNPCFRRSTMPGAEMESALP